MPGQAVAYEAGLSKASKDAGGAWGTSMQQADAVSAPAVSHRHMDDTEMADTKALQGGSACLTAQLLCSTGMEHRVADSAVYSDKPAQIRVFSCKPL